MGEKVGVSLIGSGQIAHAHLRAVQHHENLVRLVHTVDIDGDKAREAAERYGAEDWATDYRAVFDDPRVDAVIVCLPHHLHAPVSIAALEAGLHVLCEKPLALNAEEGWQMVDAAHRADKKLMVGHNRRFAVHSARARAMVHGGELGDLFHVQSSYLAYIQQASTPWRTSKEQSGGYLIPIFGTHLIDLLLWITGLTPVRVYCELAAHRRQWEGEDEASILLSLEDDGGRDIPGVVMLSANCRIGSGKRRRRDELVIAGGDHTLTYHFRDGLRIDGEPVPGDEDEKSGPSSFDVQLHEFIQAITEDRSPISTGAEGALVMDVLDACHRSAEIQRPVTIDSIRGRPETTR